MNERPLALRDRFLPLLARWPEPLDPAHTLRDYVLTALPWLRPSLDAPPPRALVHLWLRGEGHALLELICGHQAALLQGCDLSEALRYNFELFQWHENGILYEIELTPITRDTARHTLEWAFASGTLSEKQSTWHPTWGQVTLSPTPRSDEVTLSPAQIIAEVFTMSGEFTPLIHFEDLRPPGTHDVLPRLGFWLHGDHMELAWYGGEEWNSDALLTLLELIWHITREQEEPVTACFPGLLEHTSHEESFHRMWWWYRRLREVWLAAARTSCTT